MYVPSVIFRDRIKSEVHSTTMEGNMIKSSLTRQRAYPYRILRQHIRNNFGGTSHNSCSKVHRRILVPKSLKTGICGDSKTRSGSAEAIISVQDCLEVQGGFQLEGFLPVSGAKNSALALMAGCLLCSESLVLHNVPMLRDVAKMTEVLESVGVKVNREVNALHSPSLVVDASQLSCCAPGQAPVQSLRASFLVLGPLLARLHEARVPLPGGCAIGARPVDLHIRGLQALGAKVEVRNGVVHASAHGTPEGGLRGGKVYLDYPSVGATETILMAAVLAKGETVIENCAQEPEVEDLADFLISMGAKITGAGSKTIVIQGVRRLRSTDFTVIPDRIEAGTFLIAAAITSSSLTVGPIIPRHLTPIISKLEEAGCQLNLRGDSIELIPATVLRATNVTTLPYPGFPTDMQAQFMALMATAEGSSIVRETVFEGRMSHAQELQRLGANITVAGSAAYVTGLRGSGERLSGCTVSGSDLRGTAALALAGLAAEGVTVVEGLKHLVRGYEGFDVKLRGVGAKVRKIPKLPEKRI